MYYQDKVMEEIVKIIEELSYNHISIVNEDKIFKILWRLITEYNLESYVEDVKVEYFPLKQGTKILYDYEREIIEYYMWTLDSDARKTPLNEFSSLESLYLYNGLMILKSIRSEIEKIIDMYEKSLDIESFEGELLYLLYRFKRLYLKRDKTNSDKIILSDLESIYKENSELSIEDRIAEYYAYKEIIDLTKNDEVRKKLIENMKSKLNISYQHNPNPTLSYLEKMNKRNLITKEEFQHIKAKSLDVKDRFKYGLSL